MRNETFDPMASKKAGHLTPKDRREPQKEVRRCLDGMK